MLGVTLQGPLLERKKDLVLKITKVGQDVKKLEPLYFAGENVKMVHPLWKTA